MMEEETTTYILVWDMLGLEAVINATELDQQHLIDILAHKDLTQPVSSKLNHVLTSVLLRARFNSQRHYEIYAIDVSAEIDEAALRQYFEDNPQGMADLVRAKGKKIFGERLNKDKIKIT